MNIKTQVGALCQSNLFLKNSSQYHPLYEQRLLDFNLLIPDSINAQYIAPKPNYLRFDRIDKTVDFAKENGMSLQGNSLVFWLGVPDWIREGNLTNLELEQWLKYFITETVARYAGVIDTWYVINEPLDEYGRMKSDKYYIWGRIENHIEKAFTWAKDANPHARLFLNDFRAQNRRKWQANIALLDNLPKRLVSGIGIQHHHELLPGLVVPSLPAAFGIGTRSLLTTAKRRGWSVHFSEIHIFTQPNASDIIFKMQGLAYRQLLELAVWNRVESFVIWDISDRAYWQSRSHPKQSLPGLWDANLQPKPSYQILCESPYFPANKK